MTPELEFATMAAFDRIDITKGIVTGTIGKIEGGYYLWTETAYTPNDDGNFSPGDALTAMTKLCGMMDEALTKQEAQS